MAKVDIATSWGRIEKWLAAEMPAALPFLPQGVRPAAVARTEKTLGYRLPQELAEPFTRALMRIEAELLLDDAALFTATIGETRTLPNGAPTRLLHSFSAWTRTPRANRIDLHDVDATVSATDGCGIDCNASMGGS